MHQVLDRCKALKADDVNAYFKAFATQQMPKNWRTRKKCNKQIFLTIIMKIRICFCYK